MSYLSKLGRCLVIAVTSLFALTGLAGRGILGNWQTIDADTHKPSSLIYIWKHNGKYFGKIAKIYKEHGHKTTDRCVKCTGFRHNKPMLGLEIIRHMVAESGHWGDGLILDPRNGKEYHARMWLENGGRELHVRGYIGIPLFGRTDVWYRYK